MAAFDPREPGLSIDTADLSDHAGHRGAGVGRLAKHHDCMYADIADRRRTDDGWNGIERHRCRLSVGSPTQSWEQKGRS